MLVSKIIKDALESNLLAERDINLKQAAAVILSLPICLVRRPKINKLQKELFEMSVKNRATAYNYK